MIAPLTRSDTSVLSRWWWTVDKWSLVLLCTLCGVGLVLTSAASPAVAERLDLPPMHFVLRQALFVPPALAVLFMTSMLTPKQVRRLAVVVFGISVALLVLTLVAGHEIKGARRWLSIGGFSLQVSEFVKPAFAVTVAWMFAARRLGEDIPGNIIATGLLLLVIVLLLAQPDLGQTVVIVAIWFSQLFLTGLSMTWIAGLGALGIGGLVTAYFVFPHVASRVDRFFNPQNGDSYQIDRAIEAFMNGGLFGTGPGAGTVKASLPDAHADFVFAVLGEEFGLIACLILVLIFGLIVLRGFNRAMQDSDLFVVLATTGLLVQFSLQALINMASTVNLIPPKGMTLPFVSYGGSSALAIAFGMGMVLALTRRRPGEQA
ncbi:MAG: putative lipid II flippase FtsW [Gammaproteobacteria bacterium]|jgi:cell division protein FtsW